MDTEDFEEDLRYHIKRLELESEKCTKIRDELANLQNRTQDQQKINLQDINATLSKMKGEFHNPADLASDSSRWTFDSQI